MEVLIKVSQLLLSLTILVVIHECGHFFPARWFKTRVEKFYLFFNPWFSLFKKKIGDTEYGLGWLPLGGYVKISGMVDESFDMNQLKSDPQPWEFRSKPAWQRLIIMVGGVTVNFIFGFLIFAMLIWKNGQEFLPTSEMKYGIAVDSLAYEMGFRDGDIITGVGSQNIDRFDRATILKAIVLDQASEVRVMRDGNPQKISIDPKYIGLLAKPETKAMELWSVRLPAAVGKVGDGTPAKEKGLQEGDVFLAVNDQPVSYLHEVNKLVRGKPNFPAALVLKRGMDTVRIDLATNDKGMMGIQWKPITDFMKVETQSYNLLQALPAGVKTGYDLLVGQLKAFKQIFAGSIKAKDSLGGFASITNMFPHTWDWEAFWRMTAILSIILGFMNLLPIPALDGGYVVFLLIEVITGRKVPDKIVEKATMVGFILLMALMIYANGLDVVRGMGK
ncbi:MAG TPA: RIP metalloprotease RseP [Saprospiraceae bacterium]|nr:RIP metalloprotease RseP [Saprospiraceae bacterium]